MLNFETSVVPRLAPNESLKLKDEVGVIRLVRLNIKSVHTLHFALFFQIFVTLTDIVLFTTTRP